MESGMSLSGAHAASPALGVDGAVPPASWRTRLGVVALLVAAGVVYGWNVTVNGMANTFYAGAVWAGTRSWKALLFGSVDPSNFITVDKPPLSQWIMGLSGRMFGFSAASMLIPEVVMGVASVALVYATATRLAGRMAGFLAGIALLAIPVSDLMFRYNNPDAAMVLCMLVGVYGTVRAARHGSWGWLVLAGGAMGTAFLAKMLEGWMCLPALVVFYAVVAPVTWRRRVWHLVVAAVAMVVAAGWYVVLTMLWPTSKRPYLAGSTNNTFLNLVFGYNGVARVQGRSGSSHRGGGYTSASGGWAGAGQHLERSGVAGAANQWGGGMGSSAGPGRLFHGEFGLEIGWMIPAAFVAMICVFVLRRRHPRTDMVRGGALLGGLWLLINGTVLSFMQGTTHAYYTLSIAPAIAVVVGVGAATAWSVRQSAAGRVSVAAITVSAAVFSGWMLGTQTNGWARWLACAVTGLGLVVAVVLLIPAPRLFAGPLAGVLGLVAVVSALAAPAAVAVNADRTAHTGSSPSVAPRATTQGRTRTGTGWHTQTRGGRAGQNRHTTSATTGAGAGQDPHPTASATGGFSRASVDNPQLDALLRQDHAMWPAAVSGTNTAAALELQARVPVMGIGGFTGADPTPTLEQFKADVAAGKIGYYIMPASTSTRESTTQEQSQRRGGRTTSVQTQIQQWVTTTFPAQHIGTATVYNLTR